MAADTITVGITDAIAAGIITIGITATGTIGIGTTTTGAEARDSFARQAMVELWCAIAHLRISRSRVRLYRGAPE
jgi:hypothetical protein